MSYQSARKDDPREHLHGRSRASTTTSGRIPPLQLTIANTPIPARRDRQQAILSSIRRRRRAAIVDEYNRILNDKMREGVSNLERHRYITYMVGADDVDEAVPKLARIRADISTTLSRIRCNSSVLDGMERLRVIGSFIRPSKRFEFSWDKMSQYRGLRTKDLIAPNVLDFAPEGRCDAFCSDGVYGQVLAIRDFGCDA